MPIALPQWASFHAGLAVNPASTRSGPEMSFRLPIIDANTLYWMTFVSHPEWEVEDSQGAVASEIRDFGVFQRANADFKMCDTWPMLCCKNRANGA